MRFNGFQSSAVIKDDVPIGYQKTVTGLLEILNDDVQKVGQKVTVLGNTLGARVEQTHDLLCEDIDGNWLSKLDKICQKTPVFKHFWAKLVTLVGGLITAAGFSYFQNGPGSVE